MPVNEIAPDIYRIESVFGGRLLYRYLVRGDRTLLIDSGAAESPEAAIFPALDELGVEPDVLLVTHCDLDHQGGNSALRARFPRMELWCGLGDEAEVSDPKVLVDRRYGGFEHDHGVGFPTEVKPKLIALAGTSAVPVDRTLCGGERIALSDNWEVEVLHVPGHSRGHLAVFDPRSGMAVTQDAVHGRDYPFADGRPWALMPTYYYVEPYLQTVEALRARGLTGLLSAHWPAAIGEGVGIRLDETKQYTFEADEVVFSLVREGKATLRDVMDAALPLLGKWDVELIGDFACSMNGHLQRFVDAGLARRERIDGTVNFRTISDYSPPSG